MWAIVVKYRQTTIKRSRYRISHTSPPPLIQLQEGKLPHHKRHTISYALLQYFYYNWNSKAHALLPFYSVKTTAITEKAFPRSWRSYKMLSKIWCILKCFRYVILGIFENFGFDVFEHFYQLGCVYDTVQMHSVPKLETKCYQRN